MTTMVPISRNETSRNVRQRSSSGPRLTRTGNKENVFYVLGVGVGIGVTVVNIWIDFP